MCKTKLLPEYVRYMRFGWYESDSGFIICIEPCFKLEPDAFCIPVICATCNLALFKDNQNFPPIVNSEWKRCICEFILLPELADLLYEYIFPDPYCPCCQ